MDEAGGHVARRHPRGPPGDMGEQAGGAVLAIFLAMIVAQHIGGEPAEPVPVLEMGEALEGPDADMAVAQADEHRRAGGRRLVAAVELLAGLDEGEGAGRLDAQRLQHLGREDLAHAAFQREAPVAEAAMGRLPRSLGAEVHQPAAPVAHLREQEAAAVADLGIVHAELVAVIAQRQRRGERSLQRLVSAKGWSQSYVAGQLKPVANR